MNKSTPLVILLSFMIAFAGCSRNLSTAAIPKNNDLGVIEVSGGKPSSHTLADGRVCTITPTLMPNGKVKLTTTINETNVSGIVDQSSHAFEALADGRRYIFAFDKTTFITVALQQSK